MQDAIKELYSYSIYMTIVASFKMQRCNKRVIYLFDIYIIEALFKMEVAKSYLFIRIKESFIYLIYMI